MDFSEYKVYHTSAHTRTQYVHCDATIKPILESSW